MKLNKILQRIACILILVTITNTACTIEDTKEMQETKITDVTTSEIIEPKISRVPGYTYYDVSKENKEELLLKLRAINARKDFIFETVENKLPTKLDFSLLDWDIIKRLEVFSIMGKSEISYSTLKKSNDVEDLYSFFGCETNQEKEELLYMFRLLEAMYYLNDTELVNEYKIVNEIEVEFSDRDIFYTLKDIHEELYSDVLTVLVKRAYILLTKANIEYDIPIETNLYVIRYIRELAYGYSLLKFPEYMYHFEFFKSIYLKSQEAFLTGITGLPYEDIWQIYSEYKAIDNEGNIVADFSFIGEYGTDLWKSIYQKLIFEYGSEEYLIYP
jgi:hypothetical protein